MKRKRFSEAQIIGVLFDVTRLFDWAVIESKLTFPVRYANCRSIALNALSGLFPV